MIALKDVSFRFGSLTILDRFSLELKGGGVTALMGPSGCGKTTLLRLIAGLERPVSGSLRAEGKISMVFQEDRLIPLLSARGNILSAMPKGPKSERRADELLNSLELLSAGNKLPDQLSGGMRRRVALARALAFGGDILLLDEPFKGLDGKTREEVARFLFRELLPGTTVLLVTHDDAEAHAYASRVLLLGGPPLNEITVK
ncbi:MAG: ATP-binding cassette domain-containing protein [Oscillospiraceae bacterium]|jgi:NitT/TauT family transport system ATP-binding protein|nr:ATP-binding cassette domain-containing protein [Oscillospiraceae bacterium]